jgi:hypothetical protein
VFEHLGEFGFLMKGMIVDAAVFMLVFVLACKVPKRPDRGNIVNKRTITITCPGTA